MNIIHRRGWEIPEHQATPEGVFLNRRALLGAGAGLAAALVPGLASARGLILADAFANVMEQARAGRNGLDRKKAGAVNI